MGGIHSDMVWYFACGSDDGSSDEGVGSIWKKLIRNPEGNVEDKWDRIGI